MKTLEVTIEELAKALSAPAQIFGVVTRDRQQVYCLDLGRPAEAADLMEAMATLTDFCADANIGFEGVTAYGHDLEMTFVVNHE